MWHRAIRFNWGRDFCRLRASSGLSIVVKRLLAPKDRRRRKRTTDAVLNLAAKWATSLGIGPAFLGKEFQLRRLEAETLSMSGSRG
jgi:hypothetical protein